MSFLVASFGTLTIAAYGVGSTILQVVTIPAMGMSMAVSTLVGQNIGAGNIQRASRIAFSASPVGFGVLTLVGRARLRLCAVIVAFFVPSDADVIAEGARFIRIMCLAWGGMGVQLCVVSAFRASGNMLMAMVVALVAQFMVQFPLAYVLSKHTVLHADGLWWSFPVTNILVALVSLGWFARGSWKTKLLTEEDDRDRQDNRRDHHRGGSALRPCALGSSLYLRPRQHLLQVRKELLPPVLGALVELLLIWPEARLLHAQMGPRALRCENPSDDALETHRPPQV